MIDKLRAGHAEAIRLGIGEIGRVLHERLPRRIRP